MTCSQVSGGIGISAKLYRISSLLILCCGLSLPLFVGCGADSGAGEESDSAGLLSEEEAEELWMTNYDDAVAKAEEQGKPLMMLFTGSDWCPPCKQLESTVFRSQAFGAWSQENVVALKLDFPRNKPQSPAVVEQNDELSNRYRDVVEGFPTVLFLSPELDRLGNFGGYGGETPNTWIKQADRIVTQ